MLLMIPGPIPVSDAVVAAAAQPPASHLAPHIIEDFGRSIELMRQVWCADADHQPFIVAGSGTIAMDMAACNLVQPGDRVIVMNSGYFSDRMAEMLRRRGAEVTQLRADPGSAPESGDLQRELATEVYKAVFATHVDTSTGVRVDARTIAGLCRRHGVLSIFDGVCATAGERFEMSAWGADVYLTASQKAIGLPAGLALMVVSPAALSARSELSVLPPMSLDWQQWLPIHQAYEARGISYFSTPATTLLPALRVGLQEILASNDDPALAIDARFALHERAGRGMRAAWAALGLELLPETADIAANTLSAIRYPSGVGRELVGAIKERGVVVAGGLHPVLKNAYFRVGHMGHVLTQPDKLVQTINAVAGALVSQGHACDESAAVAAFWREYDG